MIFTIYEFSHKGTKIKTEKDIYVNPDHIITISPNGEYGSIILLSNGQTLTVKNSFKDILNKKEHHA